MEDEDDEVISLGLLVEAASRPLAEPSALTALLTDDPLVPCSDAMLLDDELRGDGLSKSLDETAEAEEVDSALVMRV